MPGSSWKENAGESIALGLLEIAVADTRAEFRVSRRPVPAPAFDVPFARDHDERLVHDRQALGEVRVVRQMPVAVPDREDGGDQLDLGLRRRRLDTLRIVKVAVDHAVEDLQLVIGEQHRGVPVSAGTFDQRDDFVGGLIDLEVGAAIDPALAIRSRALDPRPARHSTRGLAREAIRTPKERRGISRVGHGGNLVGRAEHRQPMRPVI